MIILDYRDKRPLYEQVGEKLQSLIVKGILEADSKMPSVRALAIELSINPNTIQRAYAELEANGYLYTVKGRGNYVSPDTEWKDGEKVQVFSEVQKLAVRAESLGISEEELLAKIRECYRKAKEQREMRKKTGESEKAEGYRDREKEEREFERKEGEQGKRDGEEDFGRNVEKEEYVEGKESMKKEVEHD